MITGSFDTAVGSVTLAIDDGGSTSTMQITDLGSLNYDFDQTPDSVTIDRVQALYSYLNVTILYQNEYGFDLWERLVDSAVSLISIPCKLTIKTWGGTSYEFGFRLRLGDISLSEISGTISLKLNPNFDGEVDIKTVFDAVRTAGKFAKFKRQGRTGNQTSVNEYDAVGVKDWIDEALNTVFENNYANTIYPSSSGLGSSYTSDIYDELQVSGNKQQFLLVELDPSIFPPTDATIKLKPATGNISIIDPLSYDTAIRVTGFGTQFLTEVKVGDSIFVKGQTFGEIDNISSNTEMTFQLQWFTPDDQTTPTDKFPEFGIANQPFSILDMQGVMQQPAIKALKELAGIEGSVFGTGFSRNFYFNRLRTEVADNVVIDFESKVVDLNPKAYYLSLGTSIVSQRASFERFGEKLYGIYPSVGGVGQSLGIPNLTDRGSITRGNPNASKELKIELAPAYPMLNKGTRDNDGKFNGDSILKDVSLESSLTGNGLRSYFQSISSTEGNILIEITLLGAFTVLPWQTLSFGALAPERYASKSFRPTSISYDLKNDTVTIKAYQIDRIFNEAVADLGFNFVFGEKLLQEGLIQAVQAQSGEAINRIEQALFRTRTSLPEGNLGDAITRIDLITTGAGIGDNEPEVGLLSKDDNIIIFDPITLKSERFVVAANQGVGQEFVLVVPKAISGRFPAGSYVYISQRDVNAGIKISQNSVQIFNQSLNVGILRQSVDGQVGSLQVRLYERVKAGTDLFIGGGTTADTRTINVLESVGPGDVTMLIGAQNITATAGTIIYGSESQKQAILQIDPFRVLTAVTQVKAQQAIATLNGDLAIGTYTSIPITSPRAMTLLPSTILMVQDRAGVTQYFTTTAVAQNITGASVINTLSTTTTVNLEDGAFILEPSWRQSSQIRQLSDEIQLRVTETRVQEIVDENLGGLLPAISLPFENSADGFTGTNATLTTNTTFLEYLATDVSPFMQRTTSYDADENPIVTIRVERVAGTNWNGAFGWSTDGTNFFTQAFNEPLGVDSDFQFATIDLTSNVDYTGTIVAIRIFLGNANLDEFYIDSLTIGKFNPQTEILSDLSSRLTTAEGNITVTANEINSYVTGTQGLNKIADVTGSYGSGTSYTSLTLANIRSGASVRDTQILILQNPDGSFQQVTVNGNQDPLASPLAINSITFSEDIDGAVLFEPSYAATSRITQSAGQIVLKAEETAGAITKLALVRLDATAADGSEIFIQADKLIVDAQATFLSSLRTNGIAGKADVNATIRSTTAPTLRADGSAVQAGDMWIKTDSGNLPHTYDGRSPFSIDGWIRDYTQIDGGLITTGTVDTNRLDVGTIISTGSIATVSDVNVTIRSTTEPTTRPDTTALVTGDIWIDTNVSEGDLPHSWNGTAFVRMYTVIDGGNITTGTIRADLVKIQNADSSPDVVLDGSGITLKQMDASNDTEVKRSIHWINSTSPTTEANQSRIVSYASGSNIGVDVAATNSSKDMRLSVRRNISDSQIDYTMGIAGTADSFITGSAIGDTCITSDKKMLIRANKSGTASMTINGSNIIVAGSVTANSLIVGTQTNKATISYTTNTARTYTIPNVAASNFVMSEGAQTINGNKTFSGNATFDSNKLLISDTVEHGVSIIVSSQGALRTLTVPTLGGNRTFAFINQAQTFSANQTFGFGNLLLRNTGNNGSATLNYGTASVNRTYTFAGDTGTVWTSGNLGLSDLSIVSPFNANRYITITFGGKQFLIEAEEI